MLSAQAVDKDIYIHKYTYIYILYLSLQTNVSSNHLRVYDIILAVGL